MWIARREACDALGGLGDAPLRRRERAAEHGRHFGELHCLDVSRNEYEAPARVDAVENPVERKQRLAFLENVIVGRSARVRDVAAVG